MNKAFLKLGGRDSAHNGIAKCFGGVSDGVRLTCRVLGPNTVTQKGGQRVDKLAAVAADL